MTEQSKVTTVQDAYKARAQVEQEGVWMDILGGEVKIKAASGRNKEFIRLTKGLQAGQRIDDDKLFDKLVNVCAQTIVLDWAGFGQDFTASGFKETCEDLRECGFLEDVMALAMDSEMFNKVALATITKN